MLTPCQKPPPFWERLLGHPTPFHAKLEGLYGDQKVLHGGRFPFEAVGCPVLFTIKPPCWASYGTPQINGHLFFRQAPIGTPFFMFRIGSFFCYRQLIDSRCANFVWFFTLAQKKNRGKGDNFLSTAHRQVSCRRRIGIRYANRPCRALRDAAGI